MIQYPRTSWWRVVLSYRGTAFQNASARVASLTLFALAVQYIYHAGLHVGWYATQHFGSLDLAGFAVVGSLLGFLIVFRMNSSNDRYWEGRTHWGMLINSARSLARCATVYAAPAHDFALLLGGYVLCIKQTLRNSRDLEELRDYLPEPLFETTSHFGNPPSAVAAALSTWVVERYRAGQLDAMEVRNFEDLLSRMVDAQGGCEKIQKTPLPFVYASLIKQLILVYLIALPVALCDTTGWWTPLIVAIVSFGFFGIEEAGVEIEDPFGLDDNCLPLDALCVTIIRDTAQLTQAFAQPAHRRESERAGGTRHGNGEKGEPVRQT